MKVPHNKGRYKSALGHCRSRVTRLCENCGASFTAEVRKIEEGGGRFCSRRCNPAYQSDEPHSKKIRRQNLMKNYGVTPAMFDAMRRKQSGLCAVCGEPPTGKREVLCVDHSPSTGKVRGLLCTQCNVGLGMFFDDPSLLRAAARYLVRAHK